MPSYCRFCNIPKEDKNHILLKCGFSDIIWDSLHAAFNVRINRLWDLKNIFLSALKAHMSAQVYNLWINGIISALWITRKLRNGAMFEDKSPSLAME